LKPRFFSQQQHDSIGINSLAHKVEEELPGNDHPLLD